MYNTAILIGANTAELVEKPFILRGVDLLRVVGREQPVRIYDLLATASFLLPSDQEKALSSYAAEFEAYRQRYRDEALELFREALLLWREDEPLRALADRCQSYKEALLPEE